MQPFKPRSAITFLKTKDLEETTRFYTQFLGFKWVLDQEACRIFRICENCHIGFCLTDGATGSSEIILTLEIPDVDGFCQKLQSMGVVIQVLPRLNEKFKIYQMFLRDPNGYLIEGAKVSRPAMGARVPAGLKF